MRNKIPLRLKEASSLWKIGGEKKGDFSSIWSQRLQGVLGCGGYMGRGGVWGGAVENIRKVEGMGKDAGLPTGVSR